MAVEADALTSLANVKEVLGITGTDDDTLLENLIDRVTEKVETRTARHFKQGAYREWHDGRGERTLQVRNWPIIHIRRLAFGEADALTVNGNVGTDLRATVNVQATQIGLHRIDSIGVAAADDVTFASSLTTSLLATAITALTGWTATSLVNISAYDLHPVGGQDALGRDVTLTYADSSDMETRVHFDRGQIELLDSQWFERGGWSAGAGDRRPTARTGRRMPGGWRNILVEYDGGFATIPEDLEQIAIELVGQAFNGRRRDTSVQSESMGSYSYTLVDQVKIGEDLAARLALWGELR